MKNNPVVHNFSIYKQHIFCFSPKQNATYISVGGVMWWRIYWRLFDIYLKTCAICSFSPRRCGTRRIIVFGFDDRLQLLFRSILYPSLLGDTGSSTSGWYWHETWEPVLAALNLLDGQIVFRLVLKCKTRLFYSVYSARYYTCWSIKLGIVINFKAESSSDITN